MMLSRVIQPSFRRALGASCGVRSYHAPSDFKEATYNDLPVPEGSWQMHNDAVQRKHNMRLLMGVGFFAFTLIVSKMSGAFQFNWAPPMKNK
ncbi:uncharacterized protein LOC124164538 [Ischnura elegans]|uniref:uncharacterized protein LOC124164538 n=1 Tax=Ischnura elegans TaxID=197161 RepID=UPI001ED8BC13|nr:uncharacterized protein LOC124164538 [Ischnura elegans]